MSRHTCGRVILFDACHRNIRCLGGFVHSRYTCLARRFTGTRGTGRLVRGPAPRFILSGGFCCGLCGGNGKGKVSMRSIGKDLIYA